MGKHIQDTPEPLSFCIGKQKMLTCIPCCLREDCTFVQPPIEEIKKMLQFKTLEGIAHEDIRLTFNEAFREYFVPIYLTPEQLTQKLWVEGFEARLSAGAFEGDRLVGHMLHGVGQWNQLTAAYNGGTGVLPNQRGQQLTQRIYNFILPHLQDNGIHLSLLEVIQENVKARRIYESVGFSIVRELDSFKGIISGALARPEVRELNAPDWEVLQSFWSWQPSWQHSLQCLKRANSSYKCYGIEREGQLVAYAVINPLNRRVPSFAVAPPWRGQGLGRQLLQHLQQLYAQEPLTFINIEHEAADTIKFLQGLGLQPLIRQFEMTRMFR